MEGGRQWEVGSGWGRETVGGNGRGPGGRQGEGRGRMLGRGERAPIAEASTTGGGSQGQKEREVRGGEGEERRCITTLMEALLRLPRLYISPPSPCPPHHSCSLARSARPCNLPISKRPSATATAPLHPPPPSPCPALLTNNTAQQEGAQGGRGSGSSRAQATAGMDAGVGSVGTWGTRRR